MRGSPMAVTECPLVVQSGRGHNRGVYLGTTKDGLQPFGQASSGSFLVRPFAIYSVIVVLSTSLSLSSFLPRHFQNPSLWFGQSKHILFDFSVESRYRVLFCGMESNFYFKSPSSISPRSSFSFTYWCFCQFFLQSFGFADLNFIFLYELLDFGL